MGTVLGGVQEPTQRRDREIRVGGLGECRNEALTRVDVVAVVEVVDEDVDERSRRDRVGKAAAHQARGDGRQPVQPRHSITVEAVSRTMTANATERAVDVRGLTKNYGELAAVASVDFTVRSGEVFGFL